MSYEGWSNYETWAAKLWLDNEQGSYNDATSAARDMLESTEDGPEYELAGWLKEYVDETMCANQPDTGLAHDLFRSAFQEIDWREIAEAYLADAREALET